MKTVFKVGDGVRVLNGIYKDLTGYIVANRFNYMRQVKFFDHRVKFFADYELELMYPAHPSAMSQASGGLPPSQQGTWGGTSPGNYIEPLPTQSCAEEQAATKIKSSTCDHKWVDYQPFQGEPYKCCAKAGCGIRFDEASKPTAASALKALSDAHIMTCSHGVKDCYFRGQYHLRGSCHKTPSPTDHVVDALNYANQYLNGIKP